MKTIYILLFLFLSPLNIIETQVYICGQTGAKKYHYNESCRGLSSCKHGTFKTSLSQAKNYGLTLFGWED